MESDSREYVDEADSMEYTGRIRKSVLNDIHRANNFFTSKIEPVLRRRHQVYEADRKYYKDNK